MILSIAHFIESLSVKYQSRLAITYYHRFRCLEYTYQELSALANKCADWLISQGLTKGDKILIYGENCPEWVVALLACGLTGIILVPVDCKSPPEFAEKIRQRTEAKRILSDNPIPNIPEDVIQIALDGLFPLINLYDPSSKDYSVTGNDILEIIYTSGTTSAPKGAVIKHKNLIASIQALREHNLSCDEKSHFLSMLPLSHVLEQNAGCLAVLRFGGHVIYTKQVRFGRILEILIKEKITHLIAVPAILKRFSNKIHEEIEARGKGASFDRFFKLAGLLPLFLKRALSLPIRNKIGRHLKAFICGGAPLDLKTEMFWENLGVKVIQGYGLTESCALSCVNTFSSRKKESVGKPIPNLSLRLGDNDEILLKGENIISEYYNAPELNAQHFNNGWYRTGDVGRLDQEGNVYIIGRLKEMILTENGLNIFPTDIEQVINKAPGIKEGAVFEDPEREGHLVAAIIAEPQSSASTSLETINKQLASHQRLGKLVPWIQPTFPKTLSLKLKRNELGKIYLSHLRDRKKTASSPADSLLNILAQITKAPLESLTPKIYLVKDLGLDSLNFVDLIISLEAQFRVEIDEGSLTSDCTIEELRSLVSDSQKAQKAPRFPRFLTSKIVSAIAPFLRFIFETILRKMISIQFAIPDLDPNQPTIFIANHSSHLDALAIQSSVPAPFKNRIRAAAAYDYFFAGHKKRGYLMHMLTIPLFPFFRDKHFSENLKNIGEILRNKEHLLFFPEGTRSRDGQMHFFKPGIGMIVKEMNAQVVPISIRGAYALWPPHKKRPKRGKLEVHYGKPLRFSKTKTAQEITAQLEESIRKHL